MGKETTCVSPHPSKKGGNGNNNVDDIKMDTLMLGSDVAQAIMHLLRIELRAKHRVICTDVLSTDRYALALERAKDSEGRDAKGYYLNRNRSVRRWMDYTVRTYASYIMSEANRRASDGAMDTSKLIIRMGGQMVHFVIGREEYRFRLVVVWEYDGIEKGAMMLL